MRLHVGLQRCRRLNCLVIHLGRGVGQPVQPRQQLLACRLQLLEPLAHPQPCLQALESRSSMLRICQGVEQSDATICLVSHMLSTVSGPARGIRLLPQRSRRAGWAPAGSPPAPAVCAVCQAAQCGTLKYSDRTPACMQIQVLARCQQSLPAGHSQISIPEAAVNR